jgi:hypothetical protein
MPIQKVQTESSRVKLDLQFLLMCLAAWRGTHDPAAGWALVTAARESRGQEKQAAFHLLKQMVEFDEAFEDLGSSRFAQQSIELESHMWKGSLAETLSGDLG